MNFIRNQDFMSSRSGLLRGAYMPSPDLKNDSTAGFFTVWGGKIILLPLYIYYKFLCWSCQIELPVTVKLGKGATFVHYGPRTFHDNAIIGEYCKFYPSILIGGQRGKGTPIIGNHVFMGAGCKIIGKVLVHDFVFICPNSVVVKDIEANTVVSGIPAKVINKKGKENVSLYEQT